MTKGYIESPEWTDKTNNFHDRAMEFSRSIEKRRNVLLQELSAIDLRISDINHYIELENLDAYRGFLAYKMLREHLGRRRLIKNEYEYLTSLNDIQIDKRSQKYLEKHKQKQYRPRKYELLFEEKKQ